MDYEGLSSHVDFVRLPDPGQRFLLGAVIGEGTYGEVFAARDTHNKKAVAIKVLENIGDNIEEIEEEYLVLRDLSLHPNIPAFYGLFLKRCPRVEDDQLWFVMELCSGGSVTDLVTGLEKRRKRLSENQIAYILGETLNALCYLHANHCMHRDVKGHNILLTDEAHIKLVDFGVSSHLAASMGRRNTSVGTPYWMAPEVIACEQQYDYSYDVRCDIWSLGITAIELADGNPPLADLHPMRALFQIPRNPPPHLQSPSYYSQEFNHFITECLVKDFEQRPVAKELIMHPFVRNISGNVEHIRRQLKEHLMELRSTGKQVKRAPEVTTKHGKLKSNRKSRLQPMFVDDLAALENLTERYSRNRVLVLKNRRISVFHFDRTIEIVTDLTKLSEISEDIVVEQLYQRYARNQIYTYIGDILLAVNPFQDPGLYTDEHSLRYRNQARSDNPPHIFAVADAAYHAMLHHLQNQCVVISGESGAGKTESANLLLKQFVALGKAPNRSLEDKILQVNPVMEAFGNARTGINDNSSRFGKFLELSFTKAGKITGAKVHVYLLEHSRVVFQANRESNFHIFTCLYDGLESQNALKRYHLDRGRRHFKNNSMESSINATGNSVLRNCNRFNTVNSGFQLLGFTVQEVDSIFRILAAILNLGDLEFVEGLSEDNTETSIIEDLQVLTDVSDLLGVGPRDMIDALTTNSVVTRGEIIHRHNSMAEAVNTRDATAKALYGRLFDWIVNRINKLLSTEQFDPFQTLGIGILDIFGFENFERNSFEQMCINIANEQLQYYFNQHVFTWEQQEYVHEGIGVDLIVFCDNRPVLDMFLSKPVGLLALLDEESHFPKATDVSLVEKFHNNIKSPYYRRPRSNDLLFTVRHYAGPVTYNAHDFLEKNRNFLPLEIIQLLRQSNYNIVRSQFQCPLTKTGNLYSASSKNDVFRNASPELSPLNYSIFGSKSKTKELASQTRAQQTSATYFRFSLMDLLQKMVHGSPHFVRCLKPNGRKAPSEFDRLAIRVQLAYAGVLEAVRIRQNGYSHRLTFADFLKRYHYLAFHFEERVMINRDSCELLLLRLKMDGWALGNTKVFLKYYHVEYLSRLYETYIRKVVLVQSCVRRWLVMTRTRRESWLMANCALTLQKYARGWLVRKKMNEMQCEEPSEEPRDDVVPDKKEKRQAPQPPTIKVGDAATPPAVKRPSDEIPEKEAALIQKYFRKWQSKNSIYQQVQRISAHNAQQLMTFSQQVQNQEAHKQQGSSNIPVPVNRSNAQSAGGKGLHKKRTAPKAPKDNSYSNGNNLNHSAGEPRSAPAASPSRSPRGPPPLQLAHRGPSPPTKSPVPTPAKRPTVQLSGWGQPQEPESVKNVVLGEHGTIKEVTTNTNIPVHDFQRFLRKVQPPPPLTRAPGGPEEDVGPYDFKRLLRKTDYAPTESLRRRKGLAVRDSRSAPPVAPPRTRPQASAASPSPPPRGRPHYVLSQAFTPHIQIVTPVFNL